LLSRTATVAESTTAHSTQWAPVSLNEDFHQVTLSGEASSQ
jgi:hypothetical protein